MRNAIKKFGLVSVLALSACGGGNSDGADLQSLNTAFNPETIHNPIEAEYKEFDTGRRHPWAEDRVM